MRPEYVCISQSVNFPSSVTKVSTNALYESGWYDNQADGVLYLGTMAYGYKGEMPDNCNIHFEDGTTIINESAFSGYLNLAGIFIPESVDTICSTAFAGCLGLAGIVCYSETTPKVAPDAFGSLTGSYTELVVPDDAVETYKAHPVWGKFQVTSYSDFINRIQGNGTYTGSFGDDADGIRSTNSDAWTSEVYDLSGRRQNAPQRGMNIIRMSDGTTRKVLVK